VGTRNLYIHFDKDLKARVFEGIELRQAREKLEIFFPKALPNELGIPSNIVRMRNCPKIATRPPTYIKKNIFARNNAYAAATIGLGLTEK